MTRNARRVDRTLGGITDAFDEAADAIAALADELLMQGYDADVVAVLAKLDAMVKETRARRGEAAGISRQRRFI